MKPLVILTGPTAVGKTSLSIELAKRINGAIISADSMQVYKHMDIGTAKITPEEMQGVRHYLIDVLEPNEPFHVVLFQQMAKTAIEEIYQNGKIPIIVGGTGFYIQAVLYDIHFEENDNDTEYRMELEQLAEQKGNKYLHDMLAQVDPVSAEHIHYNNRKRVIRALEFYKKTGTAISKHNELESQRKSPYNFEYFVLNDARLKLYDKIDRRIDEMIEQGLIEEVAFLMQQGYTKDMVSMQGLGYKEILDYLNGETTLDEAIYILKRDTRHFAKRQITWFKREKEVTWINKDQFSSEAEILEEMVTKLKEKLIIPN